MGAILHRRRFSSMAFPDSISETSVSAVLSPNIVTFREDFFYEEARKPGIIKRNSWFHGFLMEFFLVAAPPRCVLASLR
jgi:hypothetical protein